MKNDIRLYIEGQRADLSEDFSISMNYSIDEAKNPAAIRSNWSTTAVLKGTNANNRIFQNIWDLNRVNAITERKPSFEIYSNGTLAESGYVKLENVQRNGNDCQYEVTLFGGLGDFFWHLGQVTDENSDRYGEKKKLSDLSFALNDYGFPFRINKEYLNESWAYLCNPDYSPFDLSFYNTINFMRSYNGKPDSISQNKALMNINGHPFTLPNTVAWKGWDILEFDQDEDEYATSDIRSYEQRPVLRMMSLIDACTYPENNGGYTVDLDDKWFNDKNPYWIDSWVTLPKLTAIDKIQEDTENSGKTYFTHKGSGIYRIYFKDGYAPTVGTTVGIEIPFKLQLNVPGVDGNQLYSCSKVNTTPIVPGPFDKCIVAKAWYVQIIAKNSAGQIVAGSQTLRFTDPSIADKIGCIASPYYGNDYTNVDGHFERFEGDYFLWNGKANVLRLQNVKYTEGMTFEITIKEARRSIYGISFNPSIINMDLVADFREKNFKTNNTSYQIWDDVAYLPFGNGLYENGEGKVFEMVKPGMLSNTIITKEKLLSGEKSPLDYLVGYAKMFGLYFTKDVAKKKIYIRSRNSFYTGEVKDISEQVDYGKMMISPIVADKKWYDFKVGETESYFQEKYKKDYNTEFGIKRVNTNYNYDVDTRNLFDGIAYNEGITVRGKNKYMINLYDTLGSGESIPSAFLDGAHTKNREGDSETEGDYIIPRTTDAGYPLWETKFYDAEPRLHFADEENNPIDGEDVLVLFDGPRESLDINMMTKPLYITDDVIEMGEINGDKPTWIITFNEFKGDGEKIACQIFDYPQFSRYFTNSDRIIDSLDMGAPKELYATGFEINESSCIYHRQYKKFMEDKYSRDTRIVEVPVRFKEIVNQESLRKFWFFNDSYWVLNNVDGYSITDDTPTICRFTKVKDTRAYTDGQEISSNLEYFYPSPYMLKKAKDANQEKEEENPSTDEPGVIFDNEENLKQNG